MSRSNRIKAGIVKDAAGLAPQTLSTQQRKIVELMKFDTNIEDNFNQPLIYSMVELSSGDLFDGTLAAGDEVAFNSGVAHYHAHVQSVDGTVANVFPSVSADGLELNVDANATDGVLGWEVVPGGILANSRAAKTVGTDPTFIMEAKIKIDTVANVTSLTVGFRKAEAFQADFNAYDELCAIGVDDSGNIDISTILNNAATDTTDTTANWADGEEKTVRVTVDVNGKCSFSIDGSEPAVIAAFSFDAGEVVVPFIHLVSDTGNPGVSIAELNTGLRQSQ